MTIGIIGAGRFGTLTYNVLKRHKIKSKVYSPGNQIDNKRYFELEEAAGSEVIILCVPISKFERVLKDLVPFLKSDSIVIDVCSVKVYPAKLMKKYLPKSVEILATHPMFGPDSSSNGDKLEGLKFVYYPVRIKNQERYERILEFLNSLKLSLLKISPSEHDHQAAYTHAYAFLIGKLGILTGIKETEVTTKGFDLLMQNQKAVENDTGELFHDLQVYNPYTKRMRKEVKNALSKIERILKKSI